MTPSWAPFLVQTGATLAPRPLTSPAGIGDRLRTAAFAELQAEHAFKRAAELYEDAPDSLREAWRFLAIEENKHLNWLLARMNELGIEIQERPVSDALWHSLVCCEEPKVFAQRIAESEERGMRAGQRFHDTLETIDPETARIFGRIATEEKRHIELARTYYPLDENEKLSADGPR